MKHKYWKLDDKIMRGDNAEYLWHRDKWLRILPGVTSNTRRLSMIRVIILYNAAYMSSCTKPHTVISESVQSRCQQTAFFGTTDPPQPEDIKQADISQKRCVELYGENYCLISLTKKSPNT